MSKKPKTKKVSVSKCCRASIRVEGRSEKPMTTIIEYFCGRCGGQLAQKVMNHDSKTGYLWTPEKLVEGYP